MSIVAAIIAPTMMMAASIIQTGIAVGACAFRPCMEIFISPMSVLMVAMSPLIEMSVPFISPRVVFMVVMFPSTFAIFALIFSMLVCIVPSEVSIVAVVPFRLTRVALIWFRFIWISPMFVVIMASVPLMSLMVAFMALMSV